MPPLDDHAVKKLLKTLSKFKSNKPVAWGAFGEGAPGERNGRILKISHLKKAESSKAPDLWVVTTYEVTKGRPAEDCLVLRWAQTGSLVSAKRFFSTFHLTRDPLNLEVFGDRTETLFPTGNHEADKEFRITTMKILAEFLEPDCRLLLVSSSQPEYSLVSF